MGAHAATLAIGDLVWFRHAKSGRPFEHGRTDALRRATGSSRRSRPTVATVSPSEVLARALAAPPTLGTGRLICIDGLAGSRQDDAGPRLAELAPEAVVLGTDEMLEAGAACPAWGSRSRRCCARSRRDARAPWRPLGLVHADGWAETRTIEPGPLLVLGASAPAAASCRHLVTLLVWMEAERDVRLARGLALRRRGVPRPLAHLVDDEAALHAREGTRPGPTSWSAPRVGP